MWSLAGNPVVDQPIQQLCSWEAQGAAAAALAWDACACSRGDACEHSRGIQPLWVCEALKQLCAWSVQPADPSALGLSLSGRQGRPGTESHGTWVRGFGPVGGAASLCSRCSRRFQVCAPSSLICVRATGPQVSTWAPGLLILSSQSRYGGGRGTRGCCREFSSP